MAFGYYVPPQNISFDFRYMNPPAKKGEAYKPTDIEQVANCITHGVSTNNLVLNLNI